MRTFLPADVLLPKNADMTKWAVIACDQYTSNPAYWRSVAETVGDAPSTLNITLPEIFLSDNPEKRIEKINETMSDYLDRGVFKTVRNSFIYVERTLRSCGTRSGIVGKIDLEDYVYSEGSQTPVRATERTIVDRLPPRIKIRKNAPIELPHVMILIDDINKTVIEPFAALKNDREKLYDFELMKNGGHIAGYRLTDKDADTIIAALDTLDCKMSFSERYGVTDTSVLAFAVGDGNHSLATAKACYEELKTEIGEENAKNHPARYALCEIVNLHDDALKFEPIHRVLFGINSDKLFTAMTSYFENIEISETVGDGCKDDEQAFVVVTNSETVFVKLKNPPKNIAVGSLQAFLDSFIAEEGGTLDYIHGDDEVVSIVHERDSAIGFLLPEPEKNDLFKTVIVDGVLPRKTFSMGHADEKRFYLEARIITE